MPFKTLAMKSALNQPPDRFRAGGPGLGLTLYPSADRVLQLIRPANGSNGVAARPRAAARFFFSFDY
jgi:hypothetical protein